MKQLLNWSLQDRLEVRGTIKGYKIPLNEHVRLRT